MDARRIYDLSKPALPLQSLMRIRWFSQRSSAKLWEFVSAGIEWLPINKISLDQEKTKTVLNFLETLEDDDDVQHVYANLEIDNNFEVKNLA